MKQNQLRYVYFSDGSGPKPGPGPAQSPGFLGSPRPDIFCLNSKGNTTIYDLSVLHYSSGKDVKVEAPFTF